MSLTREEVARYLRGLYRFLKQGHEIKFLKTNRYHGQIYFATDNRPWHVVTLDQRSKFLSTLIHEYLHARHPDWSETKVLVMEKKLINNMSDRQVRNLVKKFAEIL